MRCWPMGCPKTRDLSTDEKGTVKWSFGESQRRDRLLYLDAYQYNKYKLMQTVKKWLVWWRVTKLHVVDVLLEMGRYTDRKQFIVLLNFFSQINCSPLSSDKKRFRVRKHNILDRSSLGRFWEGLFTQNYYWWNLKSLNVNHGYVCVYIQCI